ncbi:MAG: hypothetical protein JKY52_09545 [Flavobacteriales bacterium]|nr:hypothetical protein [Flavobacteriales bacterium]
MVKDEDWNDGYILEGLDRLHIVMCNLSDHLIEHPAIVKAEASDVISHAIELLGTVYQTVGSLDD